MHRDCPRFFKLGGGGVKGAAGGVDIVDENNVFIIYSIRVCGKSIVGKACAAFSTFLGLGAGMGRFGECRYEICGDGFVEVVIQLLCKQGGLIIEAFTQAFGVQGNGHEERVFKLCEWFNERF